MTIVGKDHLFSAHAQVPTETDISQRHKFVCIIVRVDIEAGTITDCHVPMYTQIQNDFVKEIIIGKSLYTEKELIMREIDDLMHTPSKRALLSAFQGVYNNFILTRKSFLAGNKRMNVQTGT